MCGGKVKIEEDPVLAECGLTSGTLIGGL